jgi:hypothetical protein
LQSKLFNESEAVIEEPILDDADDDSFTVPAKSYQRIYYALR